MTAQEVAASPSASACFRAGFEGVGEAGIGAAEDFMAATPWAHRPQQAGSDSEGLAVVVQDQC